MPLRFVAGSEIAQSEELIGRSLAARAEEIRARRDRLMQLRIGSQEDEILEEDDQIKFSGTDDFDHTERKRPKAFNPFYRMGRQIIFASLASILLAMAGGVWVSMKVVRKFNRNTIEIERLTDQVRAQRELSGLIAEERDMLRADLIEARESRARAEGQLLALTGTQPPVRRVTADVRGQ